MSQTQPTSIGGKIQHFMGWDVNTDFNTFRLAGMAGESRFLCLGLDPTRGLVGYLSWSFRTSFAVLFLSLSIGFFLLVTIFSLILMALGYIYPTCFQPVFNEAGTAFADAYALSWTTFTTVVSMRCIFCKIFLLI